jgi:hypothetical protein
MSTPKVWSTGALVRIRGTKAEGTIKMIEYEPVSKTVSKRSRASGKQLRAFITLNKGMTHPDMRTFNVHTYGCWDLAPIPIEDLEERIASGGNDVWTYIQAGNVEGLKTLSTARLNKKASSVNLKLMGNPINFALTIGTLDVIKVMLASDLPLVDSSGKTSLDYLFKNRTLKTKEEWNEVVNLLLLRNPKISFGKACTLFQTVYATGYNSHCVDALYKLLGKEKLIKMKGWENILTNLVRDGVTNEMTKRFIRDGFNLDESIKFLKEIPSHTTKGKELKETMLDEAYKETSKNKGDIDELIEYAKNPEHYEVEKAVKKEIGLV